MAFKKGATKRSFYKKKEEVEDKAEDVGEEEEKEDVGEESDHEDNKTLKKQKISTTSTTTTKKSTSSGERSIELGPKRKISYSEFGGAPKIDIREFYEDKASKELKPSAKGISLTFEQFQVIADNIDTILSWTKNGK